MKIPIIRIGNSKGILLSKTLLERYNFGEKLEIHMKQNHIELRPVKSPRAGWEEKFAQMHKHGDDLPLIGDIAEEKELDEWK